MIEMLEGRLLLRANPIGPDNLIIPAAAASETASGAASFWTAGRSLAASSDGREVYLQTFDESGRAIGDRTVVNTYTAGVQHNPKLAMGADGSFVIAWNSVGQDGSGSGVYAQRFDSSANKVGTEFRVNQTTTGDQVLVNLCVLRGGSILCHWVSASTMKYRQFDANGVALGGEQTEPSGFVSAIADAAGGYVEISIQNGSYHGVRRSVDGGDSGAHGTLLASLNSPASFAIDDAGDLICAYSSYDNSGQGVFYQLYSPAFIARGPAVAVNLDTAGDQTAPSVAMDPAGNFAIAYQTAAGGAGARVRTFAADGTPDADVQIGGDGLTRRYAPTVAISPDGLRNFITTTGSATYAGTQLYLQRFAAFTATPASVSGIAWRDSNFDGIRQTLESPERGDFVRLVNSDGAIIESTTVGAEGLYAFNSLMPGTSVAIEMPNVYSPSPTHVGNDPTIDSDLNRTTQRTDYFTAAPGQAISHVDGGATNITEFTGTAFIDANGDGVQNNGELGLGNATVFFDENGNGQPDATEYSARTNSTGYYKLSNLPRGVHGRIVILTPSGVRSTPLDLNVGNFGNSPLNLPCQIDIQGSPTALSGATSSIDGGTGTAASMTAAAINSAGAAIVVWAGTIGTTSGIFGRKLDASGAAVGNSLTLVDNGTSTALNWLSVAIGSNQTFVVSYINTSTNTLYVRPFNADGTPASAPIAVAGSVTVDYYQPCFPKVACDASGNFAVVWYGANDGYGSSIELRQFFATGAPRGNEITVNQTNFGDQKYPSMAMDTAGEFIVSWQSTTYDTNGIDIYARQFAADGTPKSNEFRVNLSTAGDQTVVQAAINDQGTASISWIDAQANYRYFREFDSNGAAKTGEVIGTGSYQIAIDNGGAVYFVQGGTTSKIITKASTSGLIYATTTITAPTAATSDVPGFSMNGSGTGIVSWATSSGRVYVQKFNSAPTILYSDFKLQTPTTYAMRFSEDVGSSLSESDFLFTNTSTGTTLSASDLHLSYDATTATATITFLKAALTILPSGIYQTNIAAAGVQNNSGVPLASAFSSSAFLYNMSVASNAIRLKWINTSPYGFNLYSSLASNATADFTLPSTIPVDIVGSAADDTFVLDMGSTFPRISSVTNVKFDLLGESTGGDQFVIAGTSSSDIVTLSRASFTYSYGSGLVYTFNFINGFENFELDGVGGYDELVVNSPPTGRLRFKGVAGELVLAGGTTTFNDDLQQDLPYADVFVNEGASAVFNSTQHLDELVVNGRATLTPGGGKLIAVDGSLGLSDGLLDLNDNALRITYGTSTGYIPVILSQLIAARAGGTWTGTTGMTSSFARDNPRHTTGLGMLTSDEYRSVYGNAALFSGEAVPDNALLIRYTYNGDANLDGKVTADDYALIDAGYQNQSAAGFVDDWFHGDFDFNGSINADDYALIDSAFQQQGLRPATPQRGIASKIALSDPPRRGRA